MLGDPKAKTQDEWLRETVRELEKLNEGSTNYAERILDTVKKGFQEMTEKVVGAVRDRGHSAGSDFVRRAGEAASATSRIARAANGDLGALLGGS
jgi:phosphomannomutase